MGMQMDKDRINSLINILIEERKLRVSNIFKTEAAAWAAVLAYIAIIGYLYTSEVGNPPVYKCYYINEIILTVIYVFIFIIFFAFIHTLYATIYHDTALADSILKEVTNLANTKEFDYSEYDSDEIFGLPIRVVNMKNQMLKSIQPYRGKLHPLRIMYDFIIFKWTWRKRKNVRERSTQEASINWLLLILFLASIINVWIN